MEADFIRMESPENGVASLIDKVAACSDEFYSMSTSISVENPRTKIAADRSTQLFKDLEQSLVTLKVHLLAQGSPALSMPDSPGWADCSDSDYALTPLNDHPLQNSVVPGTPDMPSISEMSPVAILNPPRSTPKTPQKKRGQKPSNKPKDSPVVSPAPAIPVQPTLEYENCFAATDMGGPEQEWHLKILSSLPRDVKDTVLGVYAVPRVTGLAIVHVTNPDAVAKSVANRWALGASFVTLDNSGYEKNETVTPLVPGKQGGQGGSRKGRKSHGRRR